MKLSSWVSEAFQPTLAYSGATSKPGVPDGTMIAEISGRPSARVPVTAVTVTSPVIAVPELVMNDFDPLITQSSPSTTAVVRTLPASEPLPDSVRPKAPSISPAASLGSHVALCSSVPKRRIGMAPRDTPASRVIAMDESTLASSSIATHSAT